MKPLNMEVVMFSFVVLLKWLILGRVKPGGITTMVMMLMLLMPLTVMTCDDPDHETPGVEESAPVSYWEPSPTTDI